LIPGLKIYPNFLSQVEEKELQERAVALHQKILSSSQNSLIEKSTSSAPSYYWSDKVVYGPVEIEEGVKINGQHFEKHSLESHQWTDFMGSKNIPAFIKNGILFRVSKLPIVRAFKQGRPLNWNFTLNTYGKLNHAYYLREQPGGAETTGSRRVSDLQDEITMIYSSGDKSEFQIRLTDHPSRVNSYPSTNSLIFLNKKACLDYKYYVKPLVESRTPPLFDKGLDSIVRIDLVLSCSRSSIDVERARGLIFGERKYSEFTQEEKALVDQYQEEMGGKSPYPNTASYLELVKAEALAFGKGGYQALTDEEKALVDKYYDLIFQANPGRMI